MRIIIKKRKGEKLNEKKNNEAVEAVYVTIK